MRRTKLLALSTSGVLALSLAACSSGGPGGGSSNGGTQDGSNTAGKANQEQAKKGQDPTAKGPAPAVAGAKKGGTLHITESGTPPTMDPSGIYYTDSNAIGGGLLYRALTQYKIVDGKAVLVPDLADGLGKESADGLTWTFKIKPGLKYNDGSPVKIADFAYAVKRSFSYESVAANGPTYQKEFLKGGDKYKGVFKDPKGAFPGVSTKGDDTLVFHLVKKMPSFNFFTSFPEFGPIPKAKDNGNNYQLHPMTTGPYQVDKFTKGRQMILSKNPNWDPETDPVRHQFPSKIEIAFSKDVKQAQTRIFNNSGDGATTVDFSPGLDASLVPQATGAKKNQFIQGPSACEYYVQMDTRQIPFDVRKAISVAYPFNQVRKAAGVASINIQPATTYSPPSLQGFKKYPVVNDAKGQGDGDPAKAKAMLKKANKLGFKLSYYYRNDTPEHVASSNARKQGLEAAGFKVKAISVSSQDFTTKIAEDTKAVNMGQGPGGWCWDWPTGDSVYPPLFKGTGFAQGLHVGFFKNAKVTAQIDKYQNEDPAKAGADWAKLDQELMTKYLPALPDYYSLNDAVFGTKLKNVVLNPTTSSPVFSDIWVS